MLILEKSISEICSGKSAKSEEIKQDIHMKAVDLKGV